MAGQGTKIVATDYNAIQAIINNVMGAGSGTYGWGQTVLSSQVAVNSKVTATQWNNLQTDLQNAYQHITGGIGSLTTASSSIKIAESDRAAYLAMANYTNTYANSLSYSTQSSTQLLQQGVKTVAWNGTVTHTVTLTFLNASYARYFFNSGSVIQFTGSLSGYSTTDTSYAKDQSWATLLTNMGTISFGLNGTSTTGTVNSIGSTVGYTYCAAHPGTSYNIIQKITSAPIYSPNQYDLNVSVDATGTVVTFTAQFEDLSTGSLESSQGGGNPSLPQFSIDENVEGTLTSSCSAYYASGVVSVAAYLPSSSQSGP
jgi:hypothetical protein